MRTTRGFTLNELVILIAAVLIVMTLFGGFAGLKSSPRDARNALESQGFTQIEVTGWKPLSCGKEDWYSTGFNATNAQGRRVSGVVCSGFIFKNATIRW